MFGAYQLPHKFGPVRHMMLRSIQKTKIVGYRKKSIKL